MFRNGSLFFFAGICVLALFGCATVKTLLDEEDGFRMQDGLLYRGDSPFTMRAVHLPGLATKGTDVSVMAPLLARIAECGGNTLCLDLCGVSADGKHLDAKVFETIAAYAERAEEQRMALLVRIPLENGPASNHKQLIRTLAKAFAPVTKAVYWLDGEDTAEWSRLFKRISPQLILAAAAGGDIRVTTDSHEAGDDGACLLQGAIPANPWGKTHFVLMDAPETYARIEAAYTTEMEKRPWTPDNSLLSEPERAEGFISLFNGRDLDGWWSFHQGGDSFRVTEEGYIEWFQSGAGAIMTRDRYGDFILRLEGRIEAGGNSGIHLRAPRACRQSRIGFEFQFMGDYDLTIPDTSSTGSVYDVLPPLTTALRPEGEWNEFELRLEGSRFRAWINGVLVQDVDFEQHEELRHRLRRGFIGLQDHSCFVQFRNIRIKPLDNPTR